MNKLEQAARQALEALEELHYSSGTVVAAKKYESATAALREALAEQAEQSQFADATLEPVAWWDGKETAFFEHELCGLKAPAGFNIPLYAAPVRKKDITDDEILQMYTMAPQAAGHVGFARAVIAADREKNK